jgi:hypothetical protein
MKITIEHLATHGYKPVSELAEVMGVKPITLYKRIARNKIEGINYRGRLYYLQSQLTLFGRGASR